MAQENKFRPDLYYRLNVFPIRVPSLRERSEDILLLVRHFVQQFSRRMGKAIDSVPADTMSALVEYHWPGNICELQNVIEACRHRHARPGIEGSLGRTRQRSKSTGTGADRRREFHAQGAGRDRANWVISGASGAAARLGMKRSTLRARMQKLGIQITRTGANRSS